MIVFKSYPIALIRESQENKIMICRSFAEIQPRNYALNVHQGQTNSDIWCNCLTQICQVNRLEGNIIGIRQKVCIGYNRSYAREDISLHL